MVIEAPASDDQRYDLDDLPDKAKKYSGRATVTAMGRVDGGDKLWVAFDLESVNCARDEGVDRHKANGSGIFYLDLDRAEEAGKWICNGNTVIVGFVCHDTMVSEPEDGPPRYCGISNGTLLFY